MLVPTYDIVNCGPRRRFVANGKLVHNSEKLNLQNLGRASKLRNAIVAPPGYLICAADLSNIELRINMCLANEQAKLAILAGGGDLYCDFSSAFYQRTITKADKDERMVGKVAELSLGYGSGWETFRQMLYTMAKGMWITQTMAEGVVTAYRGDKVHLCGDGGHWDHAKEYLKRCVAGSDTPNWTNCPLTFLHDGVIMPSGFKIKYPKMEERRARNAWGGISPQFFYRRYSKDNPSGQGFIWYGQVVENLAQALAREVLADIQDRILAEIGMLPALQVHDELVYVIPESWGGWFAAWIEAEMSKALTWWPALPLAAEAAVGPSYGDAK